ncbi:hypothetical protein K8T06_15415 [bacterium]|nr:hypothetical protein [bacterium]
MIRQNRLKWLTVIFALTILIHGFVGAVVLCECGDTDVDECQALGCGCGTPIETNRCHENYPCPFCFECAELTKDSLNIETLIPSFQNLSLGNVTETLTQSKQSIADHSRPPGHESAEINSIYGSILSRNNCVLLI